MTIRRLFHEWKAEISAWDISKQNKYWQIYEISYLAFLTVVVFTSFKRTTMFLWEIPWWVDDLQYCIANIFIIIFFFSAFLSWIEKASAPFLWKRKEMLWACIVLFTFFVAGNTSQNCELKLIAVLIVGAHNVNFSKLLKTYLIVVIPFFIIMTLCGATGIIENLVYQDGTRNSFGCVYPTDFCAHIVYSVFSLVWLLEKKIYWLISVVSIVVISAGMVIFCVARTSSLVMILFALFLFGYRIICQLRISGRATKVIGWILSLLCLVYSGVMILLCTLYDETNPIWLRLDQLSHCRLCMPNYAIRNYHIPLFGQYIRQAGAGGSVAPVVDYFFLDCSYTNVLLRYGVLAFLCAVIAWITISHRQFQRKEWVKLGILAFIALHCVMEHHWIEIAYNPFWLLLFSRQSYACADITEIAGTT